MMRRLETVRIDPLLRATWILVAVLASPSLVHAGVASVDATATIEPPVLPAPKAGGRELAHVLGDDAAAVLRVEMESELRELDAFRELVPAGGEWRLVVTVGSARRSMRELGGHRGESPDQMELTVASTGEWLRGETPQLSVPVTLSRRIPLEDSPMRREIETEFRSIFREIAQRAFADLYEKRFFRALDGRP